MTSLSVDEHLVRESLECPVCKDFFDEPKQLACGHTFCQRCIERLEKLHHHIGRPLNDFSDYTCAYAIQYAIQCPQCREHCVVPQTGFSTNYVVKEMVEKFHEIGVSTTSGSSNDKVQCDTCTRKIPREEIFMCMNCKAPNKTNKKLFLCSLCVVTRGHRNHEVVINSELASTREREQSVNSIELMENEAHELLDQSKMIEMRVQQEFEQFNKQIVQKIGIFRKFQANCMNIESTPLKQGLECNVKEAKSVAESIVQALSQLNKVAADVHQGLMAVKSNLESSSVNLLPRNLIDFEEVVPLAPCAIEMLSTNAINPSTMNPFAYSNNELENRRRVLPKRKSRRVGNNPTADDSSMITVVLD